MPVEIQKSDRTELKAFFVQNAIPTESNFAALIDASVNQKEDGLAKAANNPLSVEAGAAAAAEKRVLNLYETFGDDQPAWAFGLRAGGRSGLGLVDGAAKFNTPRLFVDGETGNVGVATATPGDALDVGGAVRMLSDSNPIRFTSTWSGFPDAATNRAEISNDTAAYKTLMIIGNKSNGGPRGPRRVSVWDRLEVNGTFAVTGSCELAGVTVRGTLSVPGVTDLGSNPIRFTSVWSGFPNSATDRAEISNDTASYKTLMIVGNKSNEGVNGPRRVSVWDRLEVNGTLLVTTQQPWQEAACINGWIPYRDRGYGAPAYFKDSLGCVHLRGLTEASGWTGGRPMFVLPTGYRPTSRVLFACQTAPNAIGRIDILPDGQVILLAGSPVWVSLHGCSFPTN